MKRRSIGRPRRESPAVGRQAIVRRTLELLSDISPAKLSLREVSRSLNTDPALIRYYFGDKAGLFTAVAQDVLDQKRKRDEAVLRRNLAGAAELRSRIDVYLEFAAINPYINQLILEMILNGSQPSARGFRKEMFARVEAQLAGLLESSEARLRGLPVDARFLHFLLIGASEAFNFMRPLLKELFPGRSNAVRLRKRYSAFVGDILVAGLGLDKRRRAHRH